MQAKEGSPPHPNAKNSPVMAQSKNVILGDLKSVETWNKLATHPNEITVNR